MHRAFTALVVVATAATALLWLGSGFAPAKLTRTSAYPLVRRASDATAQISGQSVL